jgi:hypothetical protein
MTRTRVASRPRGSAGGASRTDCHRWSDTTAVTPRPGVHRATAFDRAEHRRTGHLGRRTRVRGGCTGRASGHLLGDSEFNVAPVPPAGQGRPTIAAPCSGCRKARTGHESRESGHPLLHCCPPVGCWTKDSAGPPVDAVCARPIRAVLMKGAGSAGPAPRTKVAEESEGGNRAGVVRGVDQKSAR